MYELLTWIKQIELARYANVLMNNFFSKKFVFQSFGGILSARQLLFDADPEGKKREEESMRDFLNSREVLPQSESPFVGSNEILAGVFDVINRQVFNANFDGIQLEWCDRLKSRACISYEQITYSTKQTYLRCSKAWFKNRNRQHFVEAILVNYSPETFSCRQKILSIFFSPFSVRTDTVVRTKVWLCC